MCALFSMRLALTLLSKQSKLYDRNPKIDTPIATQSTCQLLNVRRCGSEDPRSDRQNLV